MNYQELPSEFLDRIRKMLGEEECKCFLSSYERENQKALRANPLKISREELGTLVPKDWDLKPVLWEESGAYYSSSDEVRPGRHPYHEMGLYYMQEPSAMAVAALSGAEPGERILDLCAAPGGKSTQIAGRMQGKGLLLSNEIHPVRAKILSQNMERMGVRNAIVLNETPQRLAECFPGCFDRVIVDAPCSGEGMFRKEEQALSMWSMENIRVCAERQQEILNAAAEMVCPGGTLVYSTCTFAPEEDEAAVAAFLKRHPDFEVTDLPAMLGEAMEQFGFCKGDPSLTAFPELAKEEIPAVAGSIRLWPHRLKGAGGEGHFLCRLERAGINPHMAGAEMSRASYDGKKKNKGTGRDTVPEEFKNFVRESLAEDIIKSCQEDSGSVFISFGEELYLEPGAVLLQKLKVLRPGLHLGTVKKNRFEPSHALALALGRDGARRSYVCSMQEAKAYLRGDSIPCGRDLAGWTLMILDGFPLGWAKAAGGMLKNHYPRGLRRV